MSLSVSKQAIAHIISQHNIHRPDEHFIAGGKGLTTLGTRVTADIAHRYGVDKDIANAIDVFVGQLAESYRAEIQKFRANESHTTPKWNKLIRVVASQEKKIGELKSLIAEAKRNGTEYASASRALVKKEGEHAQAVHDLVNYDAVSEAEFSAQFNSQAFTIAEAVVKAFENQQQIIQSEGRERGISQVASKLAQIEELGLLK